MLGGGAGRVVLEVVRALTGYRHVVLCADTGAYDGLGFRQELHALGAGVYRVADSDATIQTVTRLAPVALLNHWWPTARFAALTADCPVPQILIGHATMRMPPGPNAYVVLSEFQRRTQGHLPGDRVHLIPNATSLDVPGGRLGGTRGRTRVAMLTRLDVGKFPRRLLHYLPDLAACRAELVIAGRGPRRYEIEPELDALPWGGRVKFRGTVPAARAAAFLATAGVGLHLTETSMETCSLSVIEMLAAGLPVVSQPRGCLPEMVVDGENGFLAEEEGEIAERLARLLGDPALRRRMGAASLDKARSYDVRRFAASYRRLVESVVA
jgi:glycosyltransferase involved in cell wall biosynthesis